MTRQPVSTLHEIKEFLLFLVLSFYYVVESIILTLLPTKWRHLKDISGQVVLITGGAGGVGRLLALYFAQRDANVVVWDVNKEGLEDTCDLLAKEGYKAKSYVCDITDRKSVYRLALRVKVEVGPVDILVNNAGIVYCKTLLDIPDEIIQKTFDVNILSHYTTVKAFLPDMITRSRGHIVTVSSIAGMIGTYGCTDYSATKAACIGFHESLFTELKTHGHDNISLTLVCPYYINTGMFLGVKPRLLPMLEPSYVAEQIVMSVLKDEVNCTLPSFVRTTAPLKCLLPAKLCWSLMLNIIKGPQSMMQFKGINNNALTSSTITGKA